MLHTYIIDLIVIKKQDIPYLIDLKNIILDIQINIC